MPTSLNFISAALLLAGAAHADPISLRHHQGEVHAFLAIRSEGGKLLGTADEVNVPVGKVWRSRLTLHFFDGSIDDDTATYTQGKDLRLLTDHHVQKGPSFPQPSDVLIDMQKGNVTYLEVKDGKGTMQIEHMDLPTDLGNGVMPLVLQNYPSGTDEFKMSYLVNTPKPRVIKFAIHPDGASGFRLGGVRHAAEKYRLHVEIGGFTGVVAPLIGKEPPDMNAWVSSGEAPTFLKLYGFLYVGGPMVRLELASPQW
ncbi:MAG: hypothetical protein ACRYF4_02760 [Janthinobacterium lividum]